MVDMSATIIHHGHIRLLRNAKKYGYLIVGLTTDKEIFKFKGYSPELKFDERVEILSAIKYVDEVVPTNWLITEEILKKYKIDILIHGSDNLFKSQRFEVINFPRTAGISSSLLRLKAFESLISKRNRNKLMLTPGPSSICAAAIKHIEPVFGRGDTDYEKIYYEVTEWIKNLSGQDEVISLIGSATLAIEISIINFLSGDILVIDTGFYSRRIYKIISKYKNVDLINFKEIDKIDKKYDWIAACFTETSCGYKFNLGNLSRLKFKTKANLFLDATGSIGLEDGHEIADLIAFSSCKGLLGLTGAAFIAKKNNIVQNNLFNIPYYLNYNIHKEKLVTGPYHILEGLLGIKEIHHLLLENIRSFHNAFLKKYGKLLVWEFDNQPKLCTLIKANCKAINNKKVIFYKSRNVVENQSIICHLHAIDKKNIDDLEKYFIITK